MITFDKAFDRLMGHEGGYSNDPRDPGGETNWGISKRSYPHVDIKGLTREGAKAIYENDFWVSLGDMSPAVKYQVFDFAVNSGVQTATRKLQAVVGVADDGKWGPVSSAALKAQPEYKVLALYIAARLRFMTKLTAWPTFSAGWSSRIAKQLEYATEDIP